MFIVVEKGFHVAQAGLEPLVLRPQRLRFWDGRCVLPGTASLIKSPPTHWKVYLAL